MRQKKFGQLERIRNIREYWPREDTDFTPWLGSEENISILGDAIGLELEVQEQEASVGPFRADILCKNTVDNSYVLVENQFGRTDHSHLGQLFTYAAGLDAVTLVWIVESFTEEHRAALDWLNRISEEKFHFFGVEIELWKIGDSSPAPKFNVVSKPNEWVKIVRETADARRYSNLSPWQEMQKEFWGLFGGYLTEIGSEFKPPKPSVTQWMGYGIGRSYTSMIAAISKKEVWVYVQLDNHERHGWFNELHKAKVDIENEYGEALIWEERENLKYSRIRIMRAIDMTDKEKWTKAHQWIEGQMRTMKQVFRPRIKALVDVAPSSYEDDE